MLCSVVQVQRGFQPHLHWRPESRGNYINREINYANRTSVPVPAALRLREKPVKGLQNAVTGPERPHCLAATPRQPCMIGLEMAIVPTGWAGVDEVTRRIGTLQMRYAGNPLIDRIEHHIAFD